MSLIDLIIALFSTPVGAIVGVFFIAAGLGAVLEGNGHRPGTWKDKNR